MKNKMVVYSQEKADGLQDMLLDATLSRISMSSLAETINTEELQNFDLLKHKDWLSRFAKAEISDNDLYPLKTVLVSTVWNKNDDVFIPVESWAARHTPEDKPFNLRHVENDIIGHITDDRCFDENFNLIADTTPIDELPSKFHIVTAAVLYRHWREKSLQDRIEQIIAEIGEKKWFVSMECWFTSFDYGVKAEDGQHYIVARTAETAFLSKHLRAYGGTGEYNNHKIGRVLKNIVFTGKGLVENPANPESVVLASDFTPQQTLAQFIPPKKDKEKEVMGDSDKTLELETQIASLKASIQSLVAEKDALNKKLGEFDAKASQAQITSLQDTIKSGEKKITELETQVSSLTKTNEDLVKAKDEAEKSAKAANDELTTIKATQLKTSRVAKLVEAGLSTEEATAKVEKLVTATDEMFAEIVSLAGFGKKKPKKEDKKMDEEDDADAGADESELDESETEEEALSTTNEEETEEDSALMTSISSYLEANVLGKKSKNK